MSLSTRPLRFKSDRRRFLVGLAASPVALTGMGVFGPELVAQARAEGLLAANVCLVQPETTEGPYYFDPEMLRRDITEDRDGAPLRMNVQVVQADCTPIEGARVDIWHCDAEGIYSGYRNGNMGDARGQTFLRGTQLSDAQGVASFDTIYPGWYRGRAVHIHYKVFVNDTTVLTSQIFFPEAVNQKVYRKTAPYAGRGQADTPNARDRIARRAGDGAYADVRTRGAGYEAALVVGVKGAGLALPA